MLVLLSPKNQPPLISCSCCTHLLENKRLVVLKKVRTTSTSYLLTKQSHAEFQSHDCKSCYVHQQISQTMHRLVFAFMYPSSLQFINSILNVVYGNVYKLLNIAFGGQVFFFFKDYNTLTAIGHSFRLLKLRLLAIQVQSDSSILLS